MKLFWGFQLSFRDFYFIFSIFVILNKWRQMLKKNTKLSQNCTKNQKPPKKKNSEKKVVTTMQKFAPKKKWWFQSPKVRDKWRNDQIAIFASSK